MPSLRGELPLLTALFLDQRPDLIRVRQETRLALDVQRPRTRKIDVDAFTDRTGPRAEDQHAVRQVDRLVDLVRDEESGFPCALPDPEQLELHELTGLSVQRRERL